MNKHYLKPILVLLILCFTVAAAVSVTNYFTAEKIAAEDAAKVTENIALLLPGTAENTETECDAFTYYDCSGSDGKSLGRVYLIDAKGYGGPISLMVGVKPDGTVAGISIVSSSETPGMGKKAESPDFYGQFADKKADSFTVVKSDAKADDQINAISGATITSKAITDAVNTVLEHFNGSGQAVTSAAASEVSSEVSSAVPVTESNTAVDTKILENIKLLLPGTTKNTGTVSNKFTYYDCTDINGVALGRAYLIDSEGYAGPITLLVGIKADGVVAGVSILASSETPGRGQKAEDPAFYGQFTDKNVKQFSVVRGTAKSDDQISAISGATITSKAITDAVNTVLAHFNGGKQ